MAIHYTALRGDTCGVGRAELALTLSNFFPRPSQRCYVPLVRYLLLLLCSCSGSVHESPCATRFTDVHCVGSRATVEVPAGTVVEAEGQTVLGPWVPLDVDVDGAVASAECYDVTGAPYVTLVRFEWGCGQ